jgi:hypothetical protein
LLRKEPVLRGSGQAGMPFQGKPALQTETPRLGRGAAINRSIVPQR